VPGATGKIRVVGAIDKAYERDARSLNVGHPCSVLVEGNYFVVDVPFNRSWISSVGPAKEAHIASDFIESCTHIRAFPPGLSLRLNCMLLRWVGLI
jgi:hypothetical protein